MGHLARLLRLQLPAHHFHGGPEILRVRDGAAQVTQLQARYGMTGTVQTQERGGAGGAQPPLNCQLISMPLFIAKTRLPSQKWLNRSSGVQREHSLPPELLSLHWVFNAGCSAGSAPFFVIRRITPTCFTYIRNLCAATEAETMMLTIFCIQLIEPDQASSTY